MLRSRNLILFMVAILATFLPVKNTGLSAFQGQAKPPLPLLPETEKPKSGHFLGPVSCASSNCHGSVVRRNIYIVKQNEYFTWLKQDKHSKAYSVLQNEKSSLIARNMRLRDKAYKSEQCLSCHALNVVSDTQSRLIDVTEGVSCEACHGPAGGWIAKHTEAEWTHEMSVKAGMIDVRNLVIRAQTCLACHLGNVQKAVDHELIAAGHPDLTFELDNYTAALPPHWRPYTERRKRDSREETHGARAWAIGQGVAFRESLLQLARRAQSGSWPEFSEMDCYACHHSLKGKNLRQVQQDKSKALGMPRWSAARFAMLRHIVSVFAPEERQTLHEQVDQLSNYIAHISTPAENVASTANRLAEAIAQVNQKIVRSKVDDAAVKRLIGMIAKDVPYLTEADFDSVEQAVMAINTLFTSMVQSDTAMAKGKVAKVIDNLYRDVEAPERFDPDRFGKHMAELQRLVE